MNNLDGLNNISIDEFLKKEQIKRIEILREFLDDKTIAFIIENNYDFINRISTKSLEKSADYFKKIKDFDYLLVIKWYPIMLDYDRFNTIFSFLKSKNMNITEIAEIIEKSVNKDFEFADLLFENNYKVYSEKYRPSSEDLKKLSNIAKTNNETFNNFINNNIKKHGDLLRRLK